MRLPLPRIDTQTYAVAPWAVIVMAIVAGVVVAVVLFLILSLTWQVPVVPAQHFHKVPASSSCAGSGAGSWVMVNQTGVWKCRDVTGVPNSPWRVV